MASYNNEEEKELKTKTPIIVNVLPILGFSITSYFVYRKTKSVGLSFGAGGIALALSLIPRLIIMKKTLNEVKSENEAIRAKIKIIEDSDLIIDKNIPITSEQIFSVIERIAEKNGKIENLIPKKEYFLDVLDSFSQEQKNAAYDTVKAISELPENANDDDIANMMQELSEIESQYGKELIKTIDSRLNELSDEINSKGQEQTKSIAV
jgi:hypothetical protein